MKRTFVIAMLLVMALSFSGCVCPRSIFGCRGGGAGKECLCKRKADCSCPKGERKADCTCPKREACQCGKRSG